MSLSGRVFDYPTRFLIVSEEDSEQEYLVDLVEHELGLDKNGNMEFNGGCNCRDFLYRCLPKLKKPEFMGQVHRCKHVRFARSEALNILLPYLKKHDPNIHEDFQP